MKKWYQNKKLWIAAGGIGVLAAAGVVIVRHDVRISTNGVSFVFQDADGPTSVFLAGKLTGHSSSKKVSASLVFEEEVKAEADPTAVLSENEADSRDRLKKEVQADRESNLSTLPLDMTMKAVSFVDGILTLEIDNHSGYTMSYGEDYVLQKWEDGSWTDMVPEQEYGWTDIAYEIEDLTTDTITCDLTFFGELPAGKYKLIKSELEAEFELF